MIGSTVGSLFIMSLINSTTQLSVNYLGITPPKTNMTMENQPVQDVSPIKNGNFPLSC